MYEDNNNDNQRNEQNLEFYVNKQPSITTSDLQMLKFCFVTEEIAIQAKLRRVDSITGAEIVGRKATAYFDYTGIIFPYFLPEQSFPREYRLRRDKPDLELQANGTVKEKAKYLSPPKRGNMIYFPPNCSNDYLADTSLAIVITEGEKKHLHCIAHLGTDWMTRRTSHVFCR